MNSKLYRCGCCGCPTDQNGNKLIDENFKRAINIIENYNSDAHIYLIYGNCCCQNDDGNQEPQMMQITRDMAIDAGDRSLEGQWTRW